MVFDNKDDDKDDEDSNNNENSFFERIADKSRVNLDETTVISRGSVHERDQYENKKPMHANFDETILEVEREEEDKDEDDNEMMFKNRKQRLQSEDLPDNILGMKKQKLKTIKEEDDDVKQRTLSLLDDFQEDNENGLNQAMKMSNYDMDAEDENFLDRAIMISMSGSVISQQDIEKK